MSWMASRGSPTCSDVGAQPSGKLGFIHFPGGNGEHGMCRAGLIYLESKSVDVQKQADGQKGSTLVAIQKRVILRQSNTIDRSQIGEVWCAIGCKIQRTRQCGIQQTFIARANQSAVLSKTFGMQEQQRLLVDPAKLTAHLAKA